MPELTLTYNRQAMDRYNAVMNTYRAQSAYKFLGSLAHDLGAGEADELQAMIALQDAALFRCGHTHYNAGTVTTAVVIAYGIHPTLATEFDRFLCKEFPNLKRMI